MNYQELNDLTGKVIGCAIQVHKQLGPGLLEKIYQSAITIELRAASIRFSRQVPVPVIYKGALIGEHRIDLLVEDILIVELKSRERLDPIFEAQIISYMKLSQKRLGLLINFNNHLLCNGIKRFIL